MAQFEVHKTRRKKEKGKKNRLKGSRTGKGREGNEAYQTPCICGKRSHKRSTHSKASKQHQPAHSIPYKTQKHSRITSKRKTRACACVGVHFLCSPLSTFSLHPPPLPLLHGRCSGAEQPQRAIQLLLQTDASKPSYYADALRACLIAATTSPETAIHTIKVHSFCLFVFV